MHIFASKLANRSFTGVILSLVIIGSACQQPATTNTTTSANTANTNTSTTVTNANSGGGTANMTGTAIETREPDQYSATITLKAEVTGNQSINIPALSADFARSGADRRITFKLPGGEQVIYIDRADKHYVVVPNRKQYAELTPQSTGFNVPDVMTPGQLVKQIKGVQGCETAGEESFGGRSATKYRCAGAARTGTQAGNVQAESFIYVDKETGLPLRSESVINSSANVNGASGVRVVTELGNIQTSVDQSTFEVPAGMAKVDPDQVRSQVNAVLQAALTIAGNLMQQSQSGGNAQPASSMTPTPAPPAH
ncbi:MAG TPA: hypothetical protein VF723_05425 [Pyrinomonadaceae bacterium]|jgi:hypothetical protein